MPRTPPCHDSGCEPARTEHREQCNDALRNNAVQTPYLQYILFDAAKMQRETQSDKREQEQQSAAPDQRQDPEQKVAHDSDSSHGHGADH